MCSILIDNDPLVHHEQPAVAHCKKCKQLFFSAAGSQLIEHVIDYVENNYHIDEIYLHVLYLALPSFQITSFLLYALNVPLIALRLFIVYPTQVQTNNKAAIAFYEVALL